MKLSRKSRPLGNNATPPVFLFGEFQCCTSIMSSILKHLFSVQWETLSDCVIHFEKRTPDSSELQCPVRLRQFIETLLEEPVIRRWYGRFKLFPEVDPIIGFIDHATSATVLDAILQHPQRCAGSSRKVPGERLGDRAPEVSRLLSAFPNARFIHLVRDGRDAALTDFRQPFSVKNWALAALKWRGHLENWAAASRTLPGGQVLQIRYEDIVEQPEEAVRQLAEFLSPQVPLPQLQKDIQAIVQQFIKREPPRRWLYELSEEEIYTFEKIAGDHLREYGYRTLFPEVPAPSIPEVPALTRKGGKGTVRKIVSTAV